VEATKTTGRDATAEAPAAHDSLRSIFARFLKFGALAWGGPAAQIAMIKRECVDEEAWVSDETFRKTLAVYQVLPGPEAHELCVYFGRLRAGKLGALLAGLGFMLPGFILMLGLSVLYVEADLAARAVRRGRLPAAPKAVAALDTAGLAVTLLPAVGQVAAGRLELTPVAVLAGVAVLVWGAVGRIRRRVLAGAAAAASALVLVVAVPLVRLLPQVRGVWLWVSLAVLGALLLLGAASLERGRSVVAGTLRRVEERMRDWP